MKHGKTVAHCSLSEECSHRQNYFQWDRNHSLFEELWYHLLGNRSYVSSSFRVWRFWAVKASKKRTGWTRVITMRGKKWKNIVEYHEADLKEQESGLKWRCQDRSWSTNQPMFTIFEEVKRKRGRCSIRCNRSVWGRSRVKNRGNAWIALTPFSQLSFKGWLSLEIILKPAENKNNATFSWPTKINYEGRDKKRCLFFFLRSFLPLLMGSISCRCQVSKIKTTGFQLFETFVSRRARGVVERCKSVVRWGRRGEQSDHSKSNQAIRWKLMIDYLWIKQSMDVSRNLSAVKRLPNYALNVL